MNTNYIKLCERRWQEHIDKCHNCHHWVWVHNGVGKCPTGENLYDELACSIEAHRDVEKLTLETNHDKENARQS